MIHMERVQFAGRTVAGFGVGNPFPQIAYVKDVKDVTVTSPLARVGPKLAAFLGGALVSGVAGAAATAYFGEGASARDRLERNWRVLAATAATGGVVGAVVA